MRVLLEVQIPHDEFNKCQRDGTASQKLGRILEEINPESVYFYAKNGTRGAVVVCDVNDSADLPRIAEPWFLTFGATCSTHLCMTPDDLGRADIKSLGQRWS